MTTETVNVIRKQFYCELCGKRYTTNGNLKQHILVHTGEANSCSLCDKVYYRKDDLDRHICSHYGKRLQPI